jgi:GWxTD domain-containing protein
MCDQASALTPVSRPHCAKGALGDPSCERSGRPLSGEALSLPAFRFRHWAAPALAALFLVAGPASAEKLTKEDQQWLRQVGMLIQPQEEKVFRDLAAEERPEFLRLFWARRNPNGPGAQTNPARDEFEKAHADAARRYGRYGVDNDCIQMLLLFGEPDREHFMPRPMAQGAAGSTTQDAIVRQWVYHEPKGVRLSKDIVIGFDELCVMNDATRRTIMSSLQPRLASARVFNPSIEIRRDEAKHLVPLARQVPRPGPAQMLLQSPRQDFPVADEVMFMRSSSKSAALLGVLAGRLEGVVPPDPLKVVVRAETVSPQGEVVATVERGVSVRPGADGSFVAAFGLLSQPGAFTLRAGIVELGSQRGAAVSHAVDVPDFTVQGLTSSTLMFLETIAPAASAADDEPLAPFVMGQYGLVPRVGRAFSRKETMVLLCSYYGGQADAASGKASITGQLGLFRNGELLSKRVEQTVDLTNGTLVYGPLPLAGYQPGRYEAEVLIIDALSKQESKAHGSFEVKP